MIKKSFLFSILAPVALISLLLITPVYAQAGWFGEKPFAAVFSIFSKIKSFLVKEGTSDKSSGIIQANCTPPVPPKPAGIDLVSPYGVLNITPEISIAGPDNIVAVSLSLNPSLNENSIDMYTPFPAYLNDDIIDWSPKDTEPGVSFGRTNYTSLGGKFTWDISSYLPGNKTIPKPKNYWIKVRIRDTSTPKQAKYARAGSIESWQKVSYTTSGLRPGLVRAEAKGSKGFYVGKKQSPSLIMMIGKDSFKDTFLSGTPPLKPFTVAPNGYFEIQTKSLGQPGTITLNVKNAKILNGARQEAKADETITWKIQPLGTDPVQLLELSLKNSCGEDYLVDPAKSAKLPDSSKFTFPVVYDTAIQKKSEPQPKTTAPTTPAPKPTSSPETKTQKIFAKNLIVTQNRTLEGLKEWDQVTFTAKLVMSDGSTQIIKENVKWTLIGQVGNITPAGVFVAKLDDAIAEYGEGSGIVTATYIDADGNTFLGKTPTFKVETFAGDSGTEG
ncbi:MAG: hypothetical protein HYW89_04235 [Candidatus Sungiibacteriota bacterium]|uniref:Uncharacterized protein n=1 Tax=Candidatus Sungiibacteriota bacterium TaxID=2750080 RepID=A0A7T5RJD0_9BACT|nr:MAG: hypothetical protein HYW89_04235 [Candidatus Sungbacteria bacterium]